jgi:ABC-2 type transport system permease protein
MTAGTDLLTRRMTTGRPWARVMGLRSVYAKTVRDSRWPAIIVGLVAGMMFISGAAPLAAQFPTAAERIALVAQTDALPVVLRGMLGEPIAIDTMGGFMSWRIGNILPVMLALWSILALSSTLAGEARKGSLDVLLATPHARRSVALQKVAGHVTALTVAMLIAALLTWLGTVALATLPGDEVSIGAALGHFLLTGLLVLAGGSVAFATAPFVGRGQAAALGAIAAFGTFVITSYASLSPVLEVLQPLSWYSWTADHRPLAGQWDLLPVVGLAVVVTALLAIGVWGFERRDVGQTTAIRWLRLPSLPVGIGGPFRRALSDRTGAALGWGLGLGFYGVLIASSVEAFSQSLGQIEGIREMIAVLYPDLDLDQPSALLQLSFFSFGSLLFGLAAATFVSGWSGDETGNRLDVVLTGPLSRVRWFLASGGAVLAAVAITTLVVASMIAATIAVQGFDALTPFLGTLALGLYAAAFAGIGLAVGGVLRPALAGLVTGVIVIASFLLAFLGPALDLPDLLVQLSLFDHTGQPMAGVFDWAGLTVAAILAVGGLIVGALGFRRRDVGR